MTNVTDPEKKVKIKINTMSVKTDPDAVKTGSAGRLTRNKKGGIEVKKDANYQGIDTHTKSAQAQKRAAKEGDSHFSGVAAPRSGGKHHGGVVASGTNKRKLMIKALKNVKRSEASPQAKRSAIRMLKRG